MDILGIIGLVIGVLGVAYGIQAKRKSERDSKGAMMGSEVGPSIMPIRSQNGFGISLRSESEYPHFDIWVRIHDFAKDVIIDPTRFLNSILSDQIVELPDLYANRMHGQFFEIDLREKERVRLNLFVHTRNAQTHVQIVAIRDGENKRIAYKQWFAEGNEEVRIPDDFPVVNSEDRSSVFAEDEPTRKVFTKTPEGLVQVEVKKEEEPPAQ